MFDRSSATGVLLLIAVVLLCSNPVWAQVPPTTVTFTPTNPTATDVVTARVTYQGLACAFVPTTVVTGPTVRTDVAIFGCIVGPPAGIITRFVPFGPLPAGTYTYELYFQYDSEAPALQAQQPLVIAPATLAPVPALSKELLILLGLALASVAGLTLRRY